MIVLLTPSLGSWLMQIRNIFKMEEFLWSGKPFSIQNTHGLEAEFWPQRQNARPEK